MDQRPHLGPNAKKYLALFGLFTVLKALSTVLFAAVLGTALTYMARLTHTALYENSTYLSQHAYTGGIFSGTAKALIEGIPFATFGQEPGVLILMGAGALATLGRAAAAWGEGYTAQRAATGAKSELRLKMIERVLITGGVDTPDGTGGTAVLLSRGLDAVDHYYSKTLALTVSSVLTPLVLLICIALYDLPTAMFMLLTLPMILVFMVVLHRNKRETHLKAHDELTRLSDHILELVKGLPVLVGLGRARSQAQAMKDLGERYRKTTLLALKSAFMSTLWAQVLTAIAIALIAIYLVYRLIHGQMGLDIALFALFLVFEAYQPLTQLGLASQESEDGLVAMRKAQSLIDQPLPENIVAFEGDALKVSHVSVKYPRRPQILDDVSFSFPHGSTTAITGYSGCGKTTLLGVISGSVAPGLIPTGNSEPMQVTGEVSGTGSVVWVSQSPSFIATTVLNEVALYGFPAVIGSEDDLQAAQALLTETGPLSLSSAGRQHYMSYLKIVGLTQYADLAPEALSAGQMRRLAIARTLARVDALEAIGERVTVLVDEPTAHLDQAAALRVNASLAALAKTGATLLIVTHDESLTRRTDFHLHAVAGEKGTSWKLEPSKSIGWDFAAFKKAINDQNLVEEAETPASLTGPRPVRAHGIFATMKDLRALTGMSAKTFLPPLGYSVLSSLFFLTLTVLSGWLILRAAEQPAAMLVILALILVQGCGILQAYFRYVEQANLHQSVLASTNTLRVRAWRSAGRTVLSLRSLLRGDRILNRLVGDIDQLRLLIPQVMIPVVSHLVIMVLVLVLTALVHPRVFLLVALATVLASVVIPAISLYLDVKAESSAHEATSQMLRLGVSTMDAAEELRANGLNYLASTTFKNQDLKNVDAVQASAGVTGFGQALSLICWWATALATVVMSWDSIRTGTASTASAAVIVLLALSLVESTAAHAEAVRAWPTLAELVARMRPLIDTQQLDEDVEESRAEELKKTYKAPIKLEMNNVSTRWPGMKAPVFENLNGMVMSGQWLGITGASGSGKTTALATLLGFLPVESGSITLNHHQLVQDDLRGYAAWCPQSAYIFESTIANNLALAAESDQRPSDAQMMDVLDRVGLGDFVRSLPQGLNTPVGAGGSYVSGGQRQRIAIARTLLTNSPLLLMDEPTAHLDAPAAQALIAEVSQGTKGNWMARAGLTENPAVILVSHRAEDLAVCDRLVKLS